MWDHSRISSRFFFILLFMCRSICMHEFPFQFAGIFAVLFSVKQKKKISINLSGLIYVAQNMADTWKKSVSIGKGFFFILARDRSDRQHFNLLFFWMLNVIRCIGKEPVDGFFFVKLMDKCVHFIVSLSWALQTAYIQSILNGVKWTGVGTAGQRKSTIDAENLLCESQNVSQTVVISTNTHVHQRSTCQNIAAVNKSTTRFVFSIGNGPQVNLFSVELFN